MSNRPISEQRLLDHLWSHAPRNGNGAAWVTSLSQAQLVPYLDAEKPELRIAVVVTLGSSADGSLTPDYKARLLGRIASLDESTDVRMAALNTLGRMGADARSALPDIVECLGDTSEVSGSNRPGEQVFAFEIAEVSLRDVGKSLRERGEYLWWVVPRVYWKQLTGLLVFLVGWFALLSRFPRHRPITIARHVALMAVTAALPTFLACSAVLYAVNCSWVQGFLPDAVTVVPFPVAAGLSTAFVCVLPAVWVCQRKQENPIGSP